MAIGGDHAVAIKVVQKNELLGQRVQVGGRLASEDAKLRVAVALADVAENLIVGAVFLDDVDDVLED